MPNAIEIPETDFASANMALFDCPIPVGHESTWAAQYEQNLSVIAAVAPVTAEHMRPLFDKHSALADCTLKSVQAAYYHLQLERKAAQQALDELANKLTDHIPEGEPDNAAPVTTSTEPPTPIKRRGRPPGAPNGTRTPVVKLPKPVNAEHSANMLKYSKRREYLKSMEDFKNEAKRHKFLAIVQLEQQWDSYILRITEDIRAARSVHADQWPAEPGTYTGPSRQ